MNKLRSHSFTHVFSSSVLLLFLLCLFVMQGCKNYLDEEIENPNTIALLATKSVPVVCVDVFAHWNGELIYVGTACSSSGGSGGVGIGNIGSGHKPDDLVITPPYSPGGSVSGGGVYNPATGNNEYSYRLISKMYAFNSNLNLVQKDRLVYMLNGIFGTNTGRMMYNYIASRNIKINFVVDPTINYPAWYNATTKTLKIKDFNTLYYNQLGEEIIHAIQHQCFYGDLMDNRIKNYEFEVKVYFDLAAIADGTSLGYVPTFTDNNSSFMTSYINWINNIDENLQGRFTDVSGFNRLCGLWNGYSGVCNTFFEPKLLNYFFRKPVPPQPPLQYSIEVMFNN